MHLAAWWVWLRSTRQSRLRSIHTAKTNRKKQIGSRALSSRRPGDAFTNNYDKEVYNGDVGVIEAVDVEMQKIKVNIDGRMVEYDFLELDELVHAFAMSIHKAQGSEYPAVVIPHSHHYMMLQRNLLYTAVAATSSW